LSSVLLPTAFFSGGEKVPQADEGALALAVQWNSFMNGWWKLMKTLNFSARTAPSSTFGTFCSESAGEKALDETPASAIPLR
jgi:hypothetical protein